MMAKMFYTLDETRAALNKSEEEVKGLARDGRLREFRDGPRLMFKADQVDALKAELGAGGGTAASHDTGSSDSGAMLNMQDGSMPASGSGIVSLAETDQRSPGGGMAKEDTALAVDLGLSGTVGGVPSPGRVSPAGSGTGLSGTAAGSKAGITVFDIDEGHADPNAATSIGSSSGSGIQDQVNLEGIGSGSGLLDLTRESDDTSLGAELLGEITPGGAAGKRAVVSDSVPGMASIPDARPRGGSVITQPVYVEVADPWELAFGGLALAGLIAVVFGALVVTNGIYGVQPQWFDSIKTQIPAVLAGGAGLAVVFFLIGWFLGKAKAGKR
jgi:hypothetical protein